MVLSEFPQTLIVDSPLSDQPDAQLPPIATAMPAVATAVISSAYRMPAGRPPGKADAPIQVATRHGCAPLPALQKLHSALSNPAVHMVEKALARRPEARYVLTLELTAAPFVATLLHKSSVQTHLLRLDVAGFSGNLAQRISGLAQRAATG